MAAPAVSLDELLRALDRAPSLSTFGACSAGLRSSFDAHSSADSPTVCALAATWVRAFRALTSVLNAAAAVVARDNVNVDASAARAAVLLAGTGARLLSRPSLAARAAGAAVSGGSGGAPPTLLIVALGAVSEALRLAAPSAAATRTALTLAREVRQSEYSRDFLGAEPAATGALGALRARVGSLAKAMCAAVAGVNWTPPLSANNFVSCAGASSNFALPPL